MTDGTVVDVAGVLDAIREVAAARIAPAAAEMIATAASRRRASKPLPTPARWAAGPGRARRVRRRPPGARRGLRGRRGRVCLHRDGLPHALRGRRHDRRRRRRARRRIPRRCRAARRSARWRSVSAAPARTSTHRNCLPCGTTAASDLGRKSFVTSGGHADVISSLSSGEGEALDCYAVTPRGRCRVRGHLGRARHGRQLERGVLLEDSWSTPTRGSAAPARGRPGFRRGRSLLPGRTAGGQRRDRRRRRSTATIAHAPRAALRGRRLARRVQTIQHALADMESRRAARGLVRDAAGSATPVTRPRSWR